MKETRYAGTYITVTEEILHDHTYERAALRPGVQVIPYKDGKIMLMHESRTHETESRWKLVSGWLDKPEKSALEHAQEELAEEVGYISKSWTQIHHNDDTNFTVSFQTAFFVCTDLEKIDQPPVNPDIGCTVLGYDWYSFEEIFELLATGKALRDNTMLVALSYLYEKRKSNIID